MVKRSREDSDALSSSPILSSSPVVSSPNQDTDGNPSKYTQLDEINIRPETFKMISCSLPPHHRQALSFPTYDAYEIHYAKAHVNRCSACGKNFPTEHFLGLHLAENHDPLNEARKARGEKIDYDFYVVNGGIDKRSSMLRARGQGGHRRRSSAAFTATHREQRVRGYSLAKNNSTESRMTTQGDLTNGKSAPSKQVVRPQDMAEAYEDHESEGSDITSSEDEDVADKNKPDGDMTKLTKSMSALKFVPPSVRLGSGREMVKGTMSAHE